MFFYGTAKLSEPVPPSPARERISEGAIATLLRPPTDFLSTSTRTRARSKFLTYNHTQSQERGHDFS